MAHLYKDGGVYYIRFKDPSGKRKKKSAGRNAKRVEHVPLNAGAIEILEAQRLTGASESIVFLNEAGNRLDNDNIYRNLKRVLGKLNIEGGHPHTFRHTFASHLVIKGVSLCIVKDLLRHKSIKETEIYAHLAPQSTATAVEMLKSDFPEERDTAAAGAVPATSFRRAA
jgi:site-specific recombinase XerD